MVYDVIKNREYKTENTGKINNKQIFINCQFFVSAQQKFLTLFSYLNDLICTSIFYFNAIKHIYFFVLNRAIKRLIASKIKVCVYIIYVGALCIIILYI